MGPGDLMGPGSVHVVGKFTKLTNHHDQKNPNALLPFKINNFRPWINKRIFMDTRAQTALGKAQVAAMKTAQQHPWLLGCFVQQKSQARNHRDSQVRRVFTCLIINKSIFKQF